MQHKMEFRLSSVGKHGCEVCDKPVLKSEELLDDKGNVLVYFYIHGTNDEGGKYGCFAAPDEGSFDSS